MQKIYIVSENLKNMYTNIGRNMLEFEISFNIKKKVYSHFIFWGFFCYGSFLVLFLEIKPNKPNRNMLSSMGVVILCSIK